VTTPRKGILALDLSSVTGFAWGHHDAEIPVFGTWHLPVHLGRGATFAALENEIDDMLGGHTIPGVLAAEVVMEAPLDRAMQAVGEGRRNEAAAYQQFALAACTEATCYRHTVPCSAIHCNVARKNVIGSGMIPKGQAKAVVLRYCAMRGWAVPDHNAADACVLWQHRASILKRNSRIAA
jgi:hypothetical protein